MPEDLSAGIDEVPESCVLTTTFYKTDGITKASETFDEVESSVCCEEGLLRPDKESLMAACDVEYYILLAGPTCYESAAYLDSTGHATRWELS